MGRDNWSQADQRRNQFYKDQHGRRWFAVVEKNTGHPCGSITHRFDAPLIPPQMYLQLSPDPERSNEIEILYENWLRDLAVAHEEYRKEIVQVCVAREWPVPEEGQKLSAKLLDIVGPGPRPMEPVVAAVQGNAWILGLTDKADPRLAHLIETRRSRAGKVDLSQFDDYSTAPDYAELEEEYDPDATGGTRVPPKRRGRPPKAASVEA